MPQKKIELPQNLQDLGATFFDEYCDSKGMSITTPEYTIAISECDPVIGHKIEGIHWNADRDGEMLVIHLSNGKQLEIYNDPENKINLVSD